MEPSDVQEWKNELSNDSKDGVISHVLEISLLDAVSSHEYSMLSLSPLWAPIIFSTRAVEFSDILSTDMSDCSE